MFFLLCFADLRNVPQVTIQYVLLMVLCDLIAIIEFVNIFITVLLFIWCCYYYFDVVFITVLLIFWCCYYYFDVVILSSPIPWTTGCATLRTRWIIIPSCSSILSAERFFDVVIILMLLLFWAPLEHPLNTPWTP